MPSFHDDAICLRRWDFSETSQTVALLTGSHGLIRGLAKGAKRERSAFSGGFDPLTRGELGAVIKPARDLATLTSWRLEEVFWGARRNLEANRAGLYMADLVLHLIRDHDPHPTVLAKLADALRALDQPAAIDATLLAFQWSLVREVGFQPQLDRDCQTGSPLQPNATLYFHPALGGFAHAAGTGESWRVRAETLAALRTLNDAAAPPPSPAEATRRANRLLAAYCRSIIGTPLPSMRWSFSDLDA